MQTSFSLDQLADPDTAASEAEIRRCVHCGFCTATCPTYVLLGDELDSPRGRIYLMKQMLETEAEPSAEVVKHIDRCLSCLSCVTTCPSGVNYMHLVDHARAYIEQRYRRPLLDRVYRWALAWLLPHPRRFRLVLRLAPIGRLMAPLWSGIEALRPLTAMLALAPKSLSKAQPEAPVAIAGAKGRVAMLRGCVESVVRPEYRQAATRLLNRGGYEVVAIPDEGCCGAAVHHMGREAAALASARRNIDAWMREIDGKGLSAIAVTASGCGTSIKEYGYMLRNDPAYAEKAARVSMLARDISELLTEIGLPSGHAPRSEAAGITVAYHAACSLQHGQQITEAPKQLLAAAGFKVKVPLDAHLCCGSAGTYNVLQPKIASQLGDRKAASLEELQPNLIATGNVGCALQIANRTALPVIHSVELLDWATGGPVPGQLVAFINQRHPNV